MPANCQLPTEDSRSDSDVLVRVENVSKKFCRSLKRSLWYGMKDMASELTGRDSHSQQLRPDEFWAVNDVSFELKRGECLGLIGRNGAGKTTLLKMLNGLIMPDAGRIEMRGRVGAIIALGSGFNPILTGRENVYVNASILGLNKIEIDARIDEIIEFADIGDFIDAPVQSYSSGMQVRLGFAVATVLEPDVLILDEVLAVGDASFRHKCYHRINKLMRRSAVILVSHSMDYVGQLATSVGLMNKGSMRLYTECCEGISEYSKLNAYASGANNDGGAVRAFYPPVRHVDLRIVAPSVYYGDSLDVELDITSDEKVEDCILSFVAINLNEQPVMAWQTCQRAEQFTLNAGRQLIRFSIKPLLLHAGKYRWNFCILQRGSIEHLVWYMPAGTFEVRSSSRPVGNIPYLPEIGRLECIPLEPVSNAFSA